MSFSGAVPPANPPTFPTGACAGKALMMDPAPRDETGIAFALATCAACPVLTQCRAWMSTLTRKTDPGGVIAGTTADERSGHGADRKVCTRCWLPLPKVAFTYHTRNGRTRLRAWCRTCNADYAAEWRAARTPEVAA